MKSSKVWRNSHSVLWNKFFLAQNTIPVFAVYTAKGETLNSWDWCTCTPSDSALLIWGSQFTQTCSNVQNTVFIQPLGISGWLVNRWGIGTSTQQDAIRPNTHAHRSCKIPPCWSLVPCSSIRTAKQKQKTQAKRLFALHICVLWCGQDQKDTLPLL